MYIRWKEKHPKQIKWFNKKNGPLHIAYLVESKRIDGKPRQKTIYLASIKDKFLTAICHQHYFWRRIDATLETLNLPVEQRQKIEQKLLEKVPRPDEQDYQNEYQKGKEQLKEIMMML